MLLKRLPIIGLLLILGLSGCSGKGGNATQPAAPQAKDPLAGIEDWPEDPLGQFVRPTTDVLSGTIEADKTLVLSLDGVRLIASDDLLPVGTEITLIPSSIPANVAVHGTPFKVEMASQTPLPKWPIFHLEGTLAALEGSPDSWKFSGWKEGVITFAALEQAHPDLTFLGGLTSHGVCRKAVKFIPDQTCALVDAVPLKERSRQAVSRGGDIPKLVAADMGAPASTKKYHVIICHGTDGPDALPLPQLTKSFKDYCSWGPGDREPEFAQGQEVLLSPIFASLTPEQKADTQVWWFFYSSVVTGIFPQDSPGVPYVGNAVSLAKKIHQQILVPTQVAGVDSTLYLFGHSQGGLVALAAYDYLTNPANSSELGRDEAYGECILGGFIPLDSPLRGIEFASIGMAFYEIVEGVLPPASGDFDREAFDEWLDSMPGWMELLLAGLDFLTLGFEGIEDMGIMYRMDVRLPIAGLPLYNLGGNPGMAAMWARLESQSEFAGKFKPAAGFQPYGYIEEGGCPNPWTWWCTRPINSTITAIYDSNHLAIASYPPSTIFGGPIYVDDVPGGLAGSEREQMTDSLVLYWSQLGFDLDDWVPGTQLPPPLHKREHGCVALRPETETYLESDEPTVGGWMAARLSELMASAEPCPIDVITNGRVDIAIHFDEELQRDIVTIATIGKHLPGQPNWPYLMQMKSDGSFGHFHRMRQFEIPIPDAEAFAVSLLEYDGRWLVAATGGSTEMLCGLWTTENLRSPFRVLPENANNMGKYWSPCPPVIGDCMEAFEVDTAIVRNYPMMILGTRNGWVAENGFSLYVPTDWPAWESGWVYPNEGAFMGDDAWPSDPTAYSVSLTPRGQTDAAIATSYMHWDAVESEADYAINFYSTILRPTMVDDVPNPDVVFDPEALSTATVRMINGAPYVVYAAALGPVTLSCEQRQSGHIGAFWVDALGMPISHKIIDPSPGSCETCSYTLFSDRIGFEVLNGKPTIAYASRMCGEEHSMLFSAEGSQFPMSQGDWQPSLRRIVRDMPPELPLVRGVDTNGGWIGVAGTENSALIYTQFQE